MNILSYFLNYVKLVYTVILDIPIFRKIYWFYLSRKQNTILFTLNKTIFIVHF